MTRDWLRWLVFIIFTAVSGSVVYYEYQLTRPCKAPIAYAIGAVDTRFGVAQATLVAEAKAAARIWNTAGGKILLVYKPDAKLKINFVYDEREANAKLGAQIAKEQDALDTERTRIDALEAQFKEGQSAYNARVQSINARGGATPSEAAELESEKQALQQQASTINLRVASYNSDVKELNAVVAEYNKSAGHTFEEGQYVRDRVGERINIFEFIGTTQLERVLAHEFGHALGLDHNDNEKSIMYAKNESGNLVPTSDDLADLKEVCRL